MENYKRIFGDECWKDCDQTADVILDFLPRRDDLESIETVILDEFGIDVSKIELAPKKRRRMLIYSVFIPFPRTFPFMSIF